MRTKEMAVLGEELGLVISNSMMNHFNSRNCSVFDSSVIRQNKGVTRCSGITQSARLHFVGKVSGWPP